MKETANKLIEYRKGNLFSAPTGSILAHACNCQKTWGAGIAREFRIRFKGAFRYYRIYCVMMTPGRAVLINDRGFIICCLFTSYGYGKFVDSTDSILKNTKSSLIEALGKASSLGKSEIHMPKINSGKFGVPWVKTEEVILCVLKDFPGMKIIVWDPNL